MGSGNDGTFCIDSLPGTIAYISVTRGIARFRLQRGLSSMGLRAKFNLAILVAFLIGFGVAAVALRGVFVDAARDEVLQNARVMMTTANAVRKYTADDLAPLLPTEHNGKFVAETVPAFAAQTNFKAVAAASGPGWVSAARPVSPSPRAGSAPPCAGSPEPRTGSESWAMTAVNHAGDLGHRRGRCPEVSCRFTITAFAGEP